MRLCTYRRGWYYFLGEVVDDFGDLQRVRLKPKEYCPVYHFLAQTYS